MYLVAADGQCWMIGPAPLTIGRTQNNQIVVHEATVSRQHARIEQREEGVTIVDLQTPNGTFVNDQRINGAQLLQPGDRVRFGPVATFTCEVFSVSSTPLPVPTSTALQGMRSAAPTAVLPRRCPACSAPVRVGARFCPACGQTLRGGSA